MRKPIAIFFCAALVLCLLPATALADAVNYTDPTLHNIYDGSEYDQLKTFLNTPSAFAGDSNGERICGIVYSESEPYNWHGITWAPYPEGTDTVYHVTEIDWKTSGSYYDLDGSLNLSNFPYLTSFKLDYAQIDSLNVTGDTALTTLICTRTKMTDSDGNVTHTGITSLNLSTNTHLSDVQLDENSLTSLFTSAAGTNLWQLTCSDNALTSLDVSANTNLSSLICDENEITGTLDVTNYTSLLQLICDSNNLTGLVVDGCTTLQVLECDENDIAGSLDVTDSANMVLLNCGQNQLTELSVNGLNKLVNLICADNRLNELVVSTNTALVNLDCGGNQISSLALTNNTALASLTCNDNLLSALSVGSNTKLQTLYCQDNQIGTLSTSSNAELTTLDCSNNALSSLNVSANAALQILRCAGNNLGSLSVSDNSALIDLECGNCGLSELDIDANPELDILICDGNALGALDLTANTKLTTLDCSNCGLSTLDISATSLSMLVCADNDLTSLNLGSIVGFFLLDISGNQFTDLDLSGIFYFVFDCTDNPLSHIKATVLYGFSPEDSQPVELTVNGEGYVGLYASLIFPDAEFRDTIYSLEAFAQGTPKTGAAFCDWTDASDAAVSTAAKYTLSTGTDYDLTANFLSLTPSVTDGKIYTGGRITLTPSIAGGEWSFDTSALSRSGNEFTGLKAGTAHVVYTLNGSSAASFDVVVQQSQLPPTGQDFTLVWLLCGAALLCIAIQAVIMKKRSLGTR